MQKNMRHKDILRLSFKLFIVAAVLLAAALFVYFYRFEAVIENQAVKELENTTKQNRKAALYIFQSNQPLLQRISDTKNEERYMEDKEDFLSVLESWKDLYEFKDIGIIDLSGKALSVTGQEFDFSKEEFFQRSVQGQIVLSSTSEDKIDKEHIMIYCAPGQDALLLPVAEDADSLH